MAGATNCSNPLVTDSKGNYHFYSAGGTYTIQIFGSGIVTSVEPDVTIPGSIANLGGIRYANQFPSLQAAHDDLPASGGMIIIPASTTLSSAVTTAFTKPVILQGSSKDTSIYQLTATGSTLHGITTTKSLTIRDMTIKTQTPPASNLSMKGVTFDEPNNSFTNAGTNIILENVIITGFNFGVFADGRAVGLQNFDIDRFVCRNCDITSAGAASGTVAEPIFVAGANIAEISLSKLDSNSLGDHNVYGINNLNYFVHHNRLLNTPGNGLAAIKAVTQNASGLTFHDWSFRDNQMTNHGVAILVQTTENALLYNLTIDGNTVLTATDNGVSNPAAFYLSAAGTSVINQISVLNGSTDDVQQRCITFDVAASATIRNVDVVNFNCRNWGKFSSGTYSAIDGASSGTINSIKIVSLFADGGITGRAGIGLTSGNFQRVQVIDLREVNVSVPAPKTHFISSVTSASANPSTTGAVRLASTDAIGWRNNANGADISFAKDTSDRLTFGGNTVRAPIYIGFGTLQNAAHIVFDNGTLVSGTPSTATITFSGSAAFTGTNSYKCAITNETTQANPLKYARVSASQITVTGPNTVADTFTYLCVGN